MWLILAAAASLATAQEAAHLAAGYYHTCAASTLGAVYCWGWNNFGQLGDGTLTDRLAPTLVPNVNDAVEVAAGVYHTCARAGSGGSTLYCWGFNDFGQLGDSTQVARSVPVIVARLSNPVSLALGVSHTCARVSSGDAYCWGYNANGQLGDGTTAFRFLPTKVTGLSGIAGLASFYRHTCAWLVGGAAYCWGYNYYGQLGDGTTTDRLAPVRVTGLAGVVDMAVGGIHTCARLQSGAVYCWGSNDVGQLGDGTGLSNAHPVLVADLHGSVVEIAAGGWHTCAVAASGTAYCWGWNNFSQLGDRTATQSDAPVEVAALSSAVDIVAGDRHSCALTLAGEVYCWGWNGNGQLGDNTLDDRAVPTRVRYFAKAAAATSATIGGPAIAGLVVAALVVLVLVVLGVLHRKNRSKKKVAALSAPALAHEEALSQHGSSLSRHGSSLSREGSTLSRSDSAEPPPYQPYAPVGLLRRESTRSVAAVTRPCDVFISLRLAEARGEAEALKAALEAAGVSVFLCAATAGESLHAIIAQNLLLARLVVIMGTKTYGLDTGSAYSTYHELLCVVNEKKPFYLIKMCPVFDEALARFSLNNAVAYHWWEPGAALPADVVVKIKEKLQAFAADLEPAPPSPLPPSPSPQPPSPPLPVVLPSQPQPPDVDIPSYESLLPVVGDKPGWM